MSSNKTSIIKGGWYRSGETRVDNDSNSKVSGEIYATFYTMNINAYQLFELVLELIQSSTPWLILLEQISGPYTDIYPMSPGDYAAFCYMKSGSVASDTCFGTLLLLTNGKSWMPRLLPPDFSITLWCHRKKWGRGFLIAFMQVNDKNCLSE